MRLLFAHFYCYAIWTAEAGPTAEEEVMESEALMTTDDVVGQFQQFGKRPRLE